MNLYPPYVRTDISGVTTLSGRVSCIFQWNSLKARKANLKKCLSESNVLRHRPTVTMQLSCFMMMWSTEFEERPLSAVGLWMDLLALGTFPWVLKQSPQYSLQVSSQQNTAVTVCKNWLMTCMVNHPHQCLCKMTYLTMLLQSLSAKDYHVLIFLHGIIKGCQESSFALFL